MARSSACILTRLGNKRRIAHRIIPHFPDHRQYIEPFMGAGGMFFNKPKAERNLLSDLDEEVFNLWMVVLEQKEELVELWGRMPIDQKLFMYWKRHKETDPVRKALRFLFLSNFGLLGKPQTMRVFTANTKRLVTDRIDAAQRMLADCELLNQDFRQVLKLASGCRSKGSAFIYADPPYLDTQNNYVPGGFSEADSRALFDLLEGTGIRWAMSEFDHPFIVGEAARRGHRVVDLGERHNLGNRRTEILVLSYPETDEVGEAIMATQVAI